MHHPTSRSIRFDAKLMQGPQQLKFFRNKPSNNFSEHARLLLRMPLSPLWTPIEEPAPLPVTFQPASVAKASKAQSKPLHWSLGFAVALAFWATSGCRSNIRHSIYCIYLYEYDIYICIRAYGCFSNCKVRLYANCELLINPGTTHSIIQFSRDNMGNPSV